MIERRQQGATRPGSARGTSDRPPARARSASARRPVERELGRSVDDPHAAAADDTVDPVAGQLGSERQVTPQGLILDRSSDQVKRVSVAGGAIPPGRSPRRTSTVGAGGAATRADRVRPSPSVRQRSDSPRTRSPAPWASSGDRRAARDGRAGARRRPRSCAGRCATSASRRLARSPAPPSAAPMRRKGRSSTVAAHAPSSSAAQRARTRQRGRRSGRLLVPAPLDHRGDVASGLRENHGEHARRGISSASSSSRSASWSVEPDDVLGRRRR